MSYCRWSSDGFQCDLYVYRGEWAYIIHVAAKRRPRRVTDALEGIDLRAFDKDRFKANLDRQRQELDDPDNQPVPIGLSRDGDTYEFLEPRGLFNALLELRLEGYQFPDYVLDAVTEDVKDELAEIEARQ